MQDPSCACRDPPVPPAMHKIAVERPSIKYVTNKLPLGAWSRKHWPTGEVLPLTPLKKTQLAFRGSWPSDWQLHGAERVSIASSGSLGT